MNIILSLCLIFHVVNAKQHLRYRLTEYDVRLTEGQDKQVYGRGTGRSLGTVEDGDVVGMWRNHYNNGAFEIPIVFDEDDEFEGTNDMTSGQAASVLTKLREMEDKLGNIIRFVTVFNKNEFLDGYIRIGTYTSGCWSYVGRLPVIYQPQVINIGTGCDFTDTVEHEMMHALGFFHEQARPDRDDYVTIHWNNIPSQYYENFEKATNIDSRGSPYERRSVMHYSNYAFASNNNLPTMTSTDNTKPILGSAFTMTNTDMTQLRMLYRCQSSIQDFGTNCDATCPCRLDEGTCSGDDGCDGSLSCNGGVCGTPTPSPTATPTELGQTTAPTTVPPTTASPTTAPPTTAPPTEESNGLNIGLAIGLSFLGISLIIGLVFN